MENTILWNRGIKISVSKTSRASQRQDERAAPVVDSPACFRSWAAKERQQKVLPPFTIIKGNYQPTITFCGGKGENDI